MATSWHVREPRTARARQGVAAKEGCQGMIALLASLGSRATTTRAPALPTTTRLWSNSAGATHYALLLWAGASRIAHSEKQFCSLPW